MSPFKPTLSLLALAMCTTLCLSVAPAPESNAAAAEFLLAHNMARAAVGVAPLQWNQTLGRYTRLLVKYQRDNYGCQFSNMTLKRYGVNQLWSSGMSVTPRAAVESWVGKRKYYNYAANICVPNQSCGVYTQVVWRNSTQLGCAQAVCPKDVTLTICLYYPPGNVFGQKPY